MCQKSSKQRIAPICKLVSSFNYAVNWIINIEIWYTLVRQVCQEDGPSREKHQSIVRQGASNDFLLIVPAQDSCRYETTSDNKEVIDMHTNISILPAAFAAKPFKYNPEGFCCAVHGGGSG